MNGETGGLGMTAPAEGAGERTAPYPRVLFITSHAFNKETGTGITFTNLFQGWPKDCIAVAHNDPIPVTTEICDNYYRLTDSEIRRWGSRIAGAFDTASARSAKNAGEAYPRLKNKILSTLNLGKRVVFGDGLPQSGRLTPEFEAWIADYRPDLIFTILGSVGLMHLIEKVQARFDLPLVIHMMDDWPSVHHRTGMLGPWQRRRMTARINRLMELAAIRMAICEEMRAEFEKRYGHPFVRFQNTVDVDARSAQATDPANLNDPVRVVYAGSIFHNAQLTSLIDCCRAVAELNEEGRSVRLDIYSPRNLIEPCRESLEIHPIIRLLDPITDDDNFFETIAAADILLMPANFDADTVQFIRYSMPTRVPAYLAVGTPILVYGPSEIAQVAYARRTGWGLVVSQPGVAHVKTGLVRLIEDMDLRLALSLRAIETARTNHDSINVRASFQSTLMATALRT